MTAVAGQAGPAGPTTAPSWDLMIAVMGAPYADDSISTMLSWADAAAARGGRVHVWTCGYATMLTQAGLRDTKPRNALDWSAEHETTTRWVERFLAAHEGRTSWSACRFCSDERGALDHMPGVRLRPAMSFGKCVADAAKTVFVGVI